MANYVSKHTGEEIDSAVDAVATKIAKPTNAIADNILTYNGTNWVAEDRATVVKTWTAADIPTT